ncbi:MAG: biotin/lipoyl-binding protein [Verrucomicrobiota bacterium]
MPRGAWAGGWRLALAGLGLGLLAGGPGCRPGPAADTVSGTIEADTVHVASRTGGRVVSVQAREGDRLPAGQVIVELAAPELLAQREQLAAQLAEWEAGPRPPEIAAARAEAEAVAAALALARSDARRAQELLATRVNTAAEAERADAQVRTLERQLEAAR